MRRIGPWALAFFVLAGLGTLALVVVDPGMDHTILLDALAALSVTTLLFAFAVLKSFWPKRSVTLPTVMPTPPLARMPVAVRSPEIEALRTENDDLRRRLVALEEAVGREPAAS